MFDILQLDRIWIVKNFGSLAKAHAMLSEVFDSLLVVPFESHSLLITPYRFTSRRTYNNKSTPGRSGYDPSEFRPEFKRS